MGPPAFKLHSPRAIGLATFLGMPLAGGVLLALNSWRLGNLAMARECILFGFTNTWILVGLSLLNLPIGLLQLFCILGMYKLAHELQGGAFRKHLENGGRKCSLWLAAGVGLGCIVMMVVAIALLP
jgi:hypothetical protein